MNFQIHVDGGNEICLGMKNAAANLVGSQFSEKAFHHADPGPIGGLKMKIKTRVSLLPCLPFSVFMGRVIVADHMDRTFCKSRFFDQIKKADPLLMPMLLHASADDFSGSNV